MHQIFVDESLRGSSYFLCSVRIPEGKIAASRASLQSIVGRGHRRFHMTHEMHSVRQRALQVISELDFYAAVFVAKKLTGDSNFDLRERCLFAAFKHSINSGAGQLWLERSSTPYLDKQCIERFLRESPKPFPYISHQTPENEPLLWIPDILAWSYGRKGAWRAKASSLLNEIVHV
jgi:hypothetical protein